MTISLLPSPIPQLFTPNQMIEDGISLLAAGLFRMKEREGIDAAEQSASAAQSVITSMHLDFLRIKMQREQQP